MGKPTSRCRNLYEASHLKSLAAWTAKSTSGEGKQRSQVSYVYHEGRITHWSEHYAHYKQTVAALLTLQGLIQHVCIRTSISADSDCTLSLDTANLTVATAIEKA
jgi:hypothetical protein